MATPTRNLIAGKDQLDFFIVYRSEIGNSEAAFGCRMGWRLNLVGAGAEGQPSLYVCGMLSVPCTAVMTSSGLRGEDSDMDPV